MPRYRARYFGEIPGKKKGEIRRIAQGEEFDYDKPPGMWMEPVTDDPPVVDDDDDDDGPGPVPNTMSAIAAVEAQRQRDQMAQLEGKQPEKRGPGRPPKSAYSAS